MVKIPKGKKVLYVYISEDLDKRLRELIAKKYGVFVKGLLSAEVEAALYAWLAEHTHTQTEEFATSTQKRELVNPIPKHMKVFRKCLEYIREKYGVNFDEVHQLPLKFMVEAIQATRGADKRTVKKWLKLFRDLKLIKFIDVDLRRMVGIIEVI